MDGSAGLARAIAFSVAGYPIYMARTLVQIGYEPVEPDEFGRLPSLISYISIIRRQRGYASLYTGIGYYLPAVILKKSSYDVMATLTDHKVETSKCGVSELIAVCLRESALRIHTTLITYPLVTIGIGYISSTFFGTKETIEFTIENVYRGIVPKLIVEVTMVWVGIISRRLTVDLVDDEVGQAIVSRIPPFIVQSLLYPLNVISTVMADNGRSGVNPKFDNWRQCYGYLQDIRQLRRGNSLFYRRNYQPVSSSNYTSYRYSVEQSA